MTRTPRTVPSRLIADRREWLRQVLAGNEGDPELLLSGLRADDPDPWVIGLLSAWLEHDAHDDSPSIWVRLRKPPHRVAVGERPYSDRLLDPEAVYLLQAHIACRGWVDLKESRSGRDSRPFHYLRITLPPQEFRLGRIIADARKGRLVQYVDPYNFRDCRRSNMQASLAVPQAEARFGHRQQRDRAPAREQAIACSLASFAPSPWFGSAREHEAALREVYTILDDRHPLAGQPHGTSWFDTEDAFGP